MHMSRMVFAVCAVTMLAAPALAQDTGGMKMMESGEVMAIMPDGHMGTMKMSDAKMMGEMKKMAHPIKHCRMFMTGADGKMMMIDTASAAGKAACEKIAK